jgi:8-oxo-dGTP pyrophosphatase MutT (NUDIX family)
VALAVAVFPVAAEEVVAVAAGNNKPRHTGRALVIHDGNILLMERWRGSLHYFSIPGGGIETDETPEQTAVREIREETSVAIEIMRPLFEMHHGDVVHHIFLAKYLSGEPHLPEDAPEYIEGHENNRFKPGWVPIEQLPDLPLLYWEPMRAPLVTALANGFSDEVTIVTAPVTR